MKKILGKWKTLVVSLVVAIFGVLEQTDWVNLIGEGSGGIVIAVVGFIMAGLSLFTTTTVDKPEEE